MARTLVDTGVLGERRRQVVLVLVGLPVARQRQRLRSHHWANDRARDAVDAEARRDEAMEFGQVEAQQAQEVGLGVPALLVRGELGVALVGEGSVRELDVRDDAHARRAA